MPKTIHLYVWKNKVAQNFDTGPPNYKLHNKLQNLGPNESQAQN